MQFGAVETSVASLYEVRLTQRSTSGNVDGTGNPGTGTFTGPCRWVVAQPGHPRWALRYFGASTSMAFMIFKIEIARPPPPASFRPRTLSMQAASVGTGDLP